MSLLSDLFNQQYITNPSVYKGPSPFAITNPQVVGPQVVPIPAADVSKYTSMFSSAPANQNPVPPANQNPVPPANQNPVPPANQTPAVDLYAKYRDPATGKIMTPQEYAVYIASKVPKSGTGDVPQYAGDAITNPNQSTTSLLGSAYDLNNARNDLAVGQTSLFSGSDTNASGEKIIYSPTERAAIEKAYSGVYDPALKDVLTKLDTKQKQDALKATQDFELTKLAKQHEYDLELKKTPTPVSSVYGTDSTTGSIPNDVQAVLEGRNTLYNIRQTMGRTNQAATYMQAMRDAITKVDPNFDFIASDAGGKSVSTAYVQKATAAINSVLPNIQKITDLSNQVSRIGVTGVDKLIQGAGLILNNKKIQNFREAQKLIADEIGVALGAGTVSDMKLQLGFDVTDPTVSQEVFASNMEVVKEFLNNRKAGLDSLRYQSAVTGGGNNSVVNTNTNTNVVSTTNTNNDPLGIR